MATSNISRAEEAAPEQHQADLQSQGKRDGIVTLGECRPSDNNETASLPKHWQPGFRARFPWIGVLSLCTMLVCMGLVALILVTSNGKAQEEWPVDRKWHWTRDGWKGSAQLTPSIALALVNTVTNLALVVAIGQGIAIAWWRKALLGATVEDLHYSWEFGASALSLATAGKNFNLIALAALAAKLALVDNVLLQRSARTVPGQYNRHVSNLRLPVVESLPERFLGHFDGDRGWLSTAFSENLRNYFESTLLIGLGSLGKNPDNTPWDTYCSGQCLTQVEAFGWNVSCTPETTKTFNTTIESTLANQSNANKTNSSNSEDPNLLLGLHAYPVGANEPAEYYNTVLVYPEPWVCLDTNYTTAEPFSSQDGSDTCNTTFHALRCAFRPAVVRYSVAITNYTTSYSYNVNGINITSQQFIAANNVMSDHQAGLRDGQTLAHKVVRPLYFDEEDMDRYYSTPGVMAQILMTTFLANVTRRYDEEVGYVTTPGPGGLSQWYVPGSDGTSRRSCLVSAENPVGWLVDQVNNLMLRASISAALDKDNVPTTVSSDLEGDMMFDTVVYNSDYRFMTAALAIMFACILVVIPTFYGFWELGRKVTLGPMEIASAFRAPVLDHPKVAAAGEVDVLLEELGHREVLYGEMKGMGMLGVAEPQAVKKLTTAPPVRRGNRWKKK